MARPNATKGVKERRSFLVIFLNCPMPVSVFLLVETAQKGAIVHQKFSHAQMDPLPPNPYRYRLPDTAEQMVTFPQPPEKWGLFAVVVSSLVANGTAAPLIAQVSTNFLSTFLGVHGSGLAQD